MDSYVSVTDTSLEPQKPLDEDLGGAGLRPFFLVFGMVAVLVIVLFSASVSAAQPEDGPRLVSVAGEGAAAVDSNSASLEVPAVASEVVELEVDERDDQIATLHEQVAVLQQALIGIGSQSDDELPEAVAAIGDVDRRSAEFQAQSIAQWRMGYAIGGGENLSAFENTILPCESGSQPDPDLAVGRTDDWGRAQINRPTWKNRFESLTGANFEENISNPVLNGFMAAHVEEEQGLSAWTCWRIR